MSTLADEVRTRLNRYLTGLDTLVQFQDWFVPVFRDIRRSGDQEAEVLASTVDSVFLALAHGELSRDDARTALAELAVSTPPAIGPTEVAFYIESLSTHSPIRVMVENTGSPLPELSLHALPAPSSVEVPLAH